MISTHIPALAAALPAGACSPRLTAGRASFFLACRSVPNMTEPVWGSASAREGDLLQSLVPQRMKQPAAQPVGASRNGSGNTGTRDSRRDGTFFFGRGSEWRDVVRFESSMERGLREAGPRPFPHLWSRLRGTRDTRVALAGRCLRRVGAVTFFAHARPRDRVSPFLPCVSAVPSPALRSPGRAFSYHSLAGRSLSERCRAHHVDVLTGGRLAFAPVTR